MCACAAAAVPRSTREPPESPSRTRPFLTQRAPWFAYSLGFMLQSYQYSDAFAAYLRETLHLEPGARVAIQIPNGLGRITPNGHLQKRTGRWLEIRRVHFQAPRLRLVRRAERKQDEAETDGYLGNVG
jgi:hypothetical protein